MVAREVKRLRTHATTLEITPEASHQAVGGVDRFRSKTQDQMRALKLQVERQTQGGDGYNEMAGETSILDYLQMCTEQDTEDHSALQSLPQELQRNHGESLRDSVAQSS